jgi:hypothetical protein
MIAKCRRCETYFWRYRRDHPPPGYCSVVCHEERGRSPVMEQPPRTAREVLRDMYSHRRRDHDSYSILAWYDCGICDRLEAEYSQSLSWYMDHPIENSMAI